MGRNGSRSKFAWLLLGTLLLAGLSLASAQVARTIAISECRGASYWAPGKKDLCAAPSLAVKPYKIETVQDGRSALQFPNQTKVTVYGKSVFTVDKYDDKTGLAGTLKSGRIKYASAKKTGTYDAIAGKEVKLAHIGTTFLFSVGAQDAKTRPAKPTLVWKRIDPSKIKVAQVKTLMPQLCAQACAPAAWKTGTWKGSVTVKQLKVHSDLQCACLGNPNDRDGDSVVDAQDACPDQGGAPNPNRALNGCPPIEERVVLLPDADGRVGSVEIQKRATGEVLAKLDRAYESAGVTASGEVVQPTVLETKESVAAATPEPQPEPGPPSAREPSDPLDFCADRKPRSCCTGTGCDGRSCCWVFVGDDFCRADASWSIEQCFKMDGKSYGGAGSDHPVHFRWADSADAPQRTWSELGCYEDDGFFCEPVEPTPATGGSAPATGNYPPATGAHPPATGGYPPTTGAPTTTP